MKQKLSYWLSVSALGIALGFSLQFVRAWTEPTLTPPSGNIGAPINTGSSPQTKGGMITAGNFLTSGFSQAGKFCLGSQSNCITSWPSGGGGATPETDPQVGVLTSGQWCTTDGNSVNCTSNAPLTVESDPKIGTLTSGKWCTSDGNKVSCTTNAPTSGTFDAGCYDVELGGDGGWDMLANPGMGERAAYCPGGYVMKGFKSRGTGGGDHNFVATLAITCCRN